MCKFQNYRLFLILFWTGVACPKISFGNKQSILEFRGDPAQLVLNRAVDPIDGTIALKNTLPSQTFFAGQASNINFSQGILRTDDLDATLSGQLNLGVYPTLVLSGGQSVVWMDDVPYDIVVQGQNNKISGSPRFLGSVTLADSNASLELDITSELTALINVNGGCIKLLSDLRCKDYCGFTGGGVIDVNNKTLKLPAIQGAACEHDFEFLNANAIQTIDTFTTWNSQFSFTGLLTTSHIVGRGGVLQLGTSGSIRVGTLHTLYIFGINIKGFANGGTGGQFSNQAASSTVICSDTTLQLNGSYTFSVGQLIFRGKKNTILTDGNFTFTVSSTNADLIVDGTVLEYDSLTGTIPTYPFATASGGQIQLINGGVIRPAYKVGIRTLPIFNASAGGSVNIPANVDFRSSTQLIIQNTSGAARTYTINGLGHAFFFPDSATASSIIQAQTAVTINNIRVDNFDPAQITLQGSGGTLASMSYGDNSTLVVHKDLTIAAEVPFVGNGSIYGNGKTLTCSVADSLTVTGSKTLEICNATLVIANATAVRCKDVGSKIIFNNCKILVLANNWTWSTGNIDFVGDCQLWGLHNTNPDTFPLMTFAATGLLTIKACSCLKLGPNITLRHAPNISGDGGVLATQRRHIVMESYCSHIDAGFANFEVGPNGLALDRGVLHLWGDILVKRDVGQTNSALLLGTALNVQPSNFTVTTDGPIFYTTST